MKAAQFWIDHLKLSAHPEGGFYKETYRASETIPASGMPERFKGDRAFSTAIYFLLLSEDRSALHRIKSDELWHYHAGSTLSIYVFEDFKLTIHKLGSDVAAGDRLQVVVPAGCWFGAKVEQPESYTLAGCTVAPGFDFQDFEMADRKLLMREFPAYREVIEMLT